MQQKDNDFPIDQIQSSTNPPAGGLAGGTTFQPQVDGQATGATPAAPPTSPAPQAPAWQQTASSDVSQLYQQPEAPASPVPVPPIIPTAPQTPPAGEATGLIIPTTDPNQPPVAMQQDFSQANQLATPTPAQDPTSIANPPQPNAPVPPTTPQEPIVPMSELNNTPAPAPVDMAALSAAPMLNAEPTVPMPPNPMMSAVAPEQAPMSVPGLPGSDQLGPAAMGVDQPPLGSGLDPNMAGVDPLSANMEGMGAYGPPPNNKKKLLLIIGGAILGIVIIGVAIFVITRSSARKPAQNLNPTPAPAENTQPTPVPSSGPATPPQGYVTIERQCYTFALYDPNTVPADQACSFKDATFGKLKTSKISVATTTEAYKNLDELVNAIKPTLTVTSEESIKLDNFDAKQLIYKASDGKTYSRVLALIVGKSYQQDGKAVTGIDITTSNQDDFDETVTKNVLDTWRWK